MKKVKNNLFIAAFSIMGMMGFASCENAEKGAIENAIYVSEANQNIDKKVPIDDKGAVTTLTVRAANIVGSKVTVSFKKDESLLDSYNKRYGTNYKALPDNIVKIRRDIHQVIGELRIAIRVTIITIRITERTITLINQTKTCCRIFTPVSRIRSGQ